MIRRSFQIVTCCFFAAAWATALGTAAASPAADEPKPKTSAAAGEGGETKSPAAAQATTGPQEAEPAAPSEAEQIARLQRSIAADREKLAELQAKLDDPQSEYKKAEAEFTEIDAELEEQKNRLEELKKSGQAEAAEALAADLEDLQKRWQLAKDRFDLAIQERKTLQEQIATLQTKNQQEQAALDKLTGAAEPKPPTTQPAAETAGGPQPKGEQAPASAPVGEPKGPPAAQELTETPTTTAPAKEKPKSEALVKAEEEAEEKETAAREAEAEARSLTERIEALRGLVDAERKQLETARLKADNAQKTQHLLQQQLQEKWTQGATREQLQPLRGRIAEAQQRYSDARAEVRESADELDKLQSQLASLQSQQIAALREAEQAQQEAQKAKETVERLRNPFAPENILRWLIDHGPKVLAIALGMLAFVWGSRLLEGRMVKLLLLRPGRGSREDREARAKTLVGAFHHAAMVVIVVGGILMILQEVGAPIAPLLGGAAVIGLAVAFGAQNLIRDYFTGFLILMENQYTINDVVKICGIGGLVERITLRVTVLRDLEGVVHFIPNGQITTVSNMTHEWSRALFNIGVAYKEDVDQVIDVLMDLGRELRKDPDFAGLILDDPEMLGVDSLGDSAVVIKFFIKTRPLKQWNVKREMLRRVKKKFDELGIEIPYPHRTIFHRHVTEAGAAGTTASQTPWPPGAGPQR